MFCRKILLDSSGIHWRWHFTLRLTRLSQHSKDRMCQVARVHAFVAYADSRAWSRSDLVLPINSFHSRFEGGLHFEEPPSPMGDLDGGLHLEEPPSPIGSRLLRRFPLRWSSIAHHRHDILQSSREGYEKQVLAGLYEASVGTARKILRKNAPFRSSRSWPTYIKLEHRRV